MNTSSIRIIGGRNKSYRIAFKATPALRPTTDRAKETLFSWLQFELKDKSCLDLFAGTGSLGLEALSRGAKHSTFIEKDKSLYKNILKNINQLEYKDSTQVICSDSLKWLSINKRKFDLIFLDPPFDQLNYETLLRTIYGSNIMNDEEKSSLKQASIVISNFIQLKKFLKIR